VGKVRVFDKDKVNIPLNNPTLFRL